MDLYPVILYIQKNYWDKTAMKEEHLAKISRYSVSHFRFLFKKEVGCTVQEFILKTRLSYAAYSLRSTTLSILTIAMDSSFAIYRISIEHFQSVIIVLLRNIEKRIAISQIDFSTVLLNMKTISGRLTLIALKIE